MNQLALQFGPPDRCFKTATVVLFSRYVTKLAEGACGVWSGAHARVQKTRLSIVSEGSESLARIAECMRLLGRWRKMVSRRRQ
jgi:hypothetical protein